MTTVFGGFSQTAADDIEAARAVERRVFDDIDRLDLQRNAWELDSKGYTILSPEQVAPSEFINRLRGTILAVAERRHRIRPDLTTGLGRTGDAMAHGSGIAMAGMLLEDRIFELALMNERVLALISYLVGDSCDLSAMGGILKTQGPEHLELHTDLVGNPSPFPPYAQTANATWLLTDYSRENGGTCFVDGSHLRCRPPSSVEATDLSLFKPIQAPAGSVLIWGSNVWHGSLPRTVPGLRVSLLCFFVRWYLYKAEPDLAKSVTQEMVDRNPIRFRRLVGLDPVTIAAPENDTILTMGRAAQSQFA